VWLAVLARVGLVAKGISFAIVGVLALELALGEGGKSTSREGALATLARHGFGKALLFALAAGFAAYALWRVAQALFERDEEDTKRWAKRAGYLGRAAIYAGLTYSAIKLATGHTAMQSQNERAHKTTAQILSWPAGRWLVGLAGACIAGAGLYNGYRGVTKSFVEKWDSAGMSDSVRRWATRIGVVGLLARLVVFSLIGFFAIRAAIEYDPQEAIGLDGALQKLTHQSYGPWLLGITAAGLLAYALFCFADARYRRV
jgi:NADH:ubiquinone oxidoreductase subunit 5 (subunit L)/multisubunit Na+/H+ antiporter MnhA subunit